MNELSLPNISKHNKWTNRASSVPRGDTKDVPRELRFFTVALPCWRHTHRKITKILAGVYKVEEGAYELPYNIIQLDVLSISNTLLCPPRELG